MKHALLIFICFTTAITIFAQKETYDVINFEAPIGWKKNIEENLISYTSIKNKNWCRINIVKSTISKGSIEADFESEWDLILKNYNPTGKRKENDIQEAEGWKIKAGSTKFIFESNEAMAMLTTATGYYRCASIVAVTNSKEYLKDVQALIASVQFIKPELVSTQNSDAEYDKNTVVGTWKNTGSVNPSFYDAYATSIAGYSSNQYIFNANETYHFVSKTFGMSLASIFLVKENGTYQVSGNNITISPQKSIIEAWSKKDGVDNWGSRLSSQNRPLEKVTYQFTKHYFSGIQEWNLVFQNNTSTQRDGPHSNNKTFDNAWYYAPISAINTAIELPNGEKITTNVQIVPVQETNDATTILGTWVKSESDISTYRTQNGVMSYITRQYNFNENGTYFFYTKTYDPFLNKTLLGIENGTYKIIDTQITITPKKNVLEAWSKINNNDQWGKKLSSQNLQLEKATYTFTKNYSKIMKRWNLVLQTISETKRDGYFSSIKTFGNAYFYAEVAYNNQAIELP